MGPAHIQLPSRRASLLGTNVAECIAETTRHQTARLLERSVPLRQEGGPDVDVYPTMPSPLNRGLRLSLKWRIASPGQVVNNLLRGEENDRSTGGGESVGRTRQRLRGNEEEEVPLRNPEGHPTRPGDASQIVELELWSRVVGPPDPLEAHLSPGAGEPP